MMEIARAGFVLVGLRRTVIQLVDSSQSQNPRSHSSSKEFACIVAWKQHYSALEVRLHEKAVNVYYITQVAQVVGRVVGSLYDNRAQRVFCYLRPLVAAGRRVC